MVRVLVAGDMRILRDTLVAGSPGVGVRVMCILHVRDGAVRTVTSC
jgi:hypothetical protein